MKKLIQRFKRWKCWRDYNKLSNADQLIMRMFSVDPESKIKRGEL